MSEAKLKKLFAAANLEIAPMPPADFADDVLRAARREPMGKAPGIVSIVDQLNFLFPRLALAAAAVIVLCATANFLLPGAEDELAATDQPVNVEDL